MCLAQGPQHSDAGEARTRGPSVSSHTLNDFKNAKNENFPFLHPEHFLPSLTDKNG